MAKKKSGSEPNKRKRIKKSGKNWFDAVDKGKKKSKAESISKMESKLPKIKERKKNSISVRRPQVHQNKDAPNELPEEIRLNRYIAMSGVCSRREADSLIQAGRIKVNGKIVKELGIKISRLKDRVEMDGNSLSLEKPVYILLNKQKNVITTTKDPLGRRTVLDAIERATQARVYPVGRLDRHTTGLLLLTNDGELARKMTDPDRKVKEVYHVRLNKPLPEDAMHQLIQGVELEDGIAKAHKIDYVIGKLQNEIGLEILNSRQRIVHRMFESLGYKIEGLDRVMIASLTKKRLARGRWRELSEREISFLKMI